MIAKDRRTADMVADIGAALAKRRGREFTLGDLAYWTGWGYAYLGNFARSGALEQFADKQDRVGHWTIWRAK